MLLFVNKHGRTLYNYDSSMKYIFYETILPFFFLFNQFIIKLNYSFTSTYT